MAGFGVFKHSQNAQTYAFNPKKLQCLDIGSLGKQGSTVGKLVESSAWDDDLCSVNSGLTTLVWNGWLGMLIVQWNWVWCLPIEVLGAWGYDLRSGTGVVAAVTSKMLLVF